VDKEERGKRVRDILAHQARGKGSSRRNSSWLGSTSGRFMEWKMRGVEEKNVLHDNS